MIAPRCNVGRPLLLFREVARISLARLTQPFDLMEGTDAHDTCSSQQQAEPLENNVTGADASAGGYCVDASPKSDNLKCGKICARRKDKSTERARECASAQLRFAISLLQLAHE